MHKLYVDVDTRYARARQTGVTIVEAAADSRAMRVQLSPTDL